MNAANLLTLSRLVATPFVAWLMYGESPAAKYAALVLFIAAMLTDCLDGPLARRCGRTVLGNYLDPVADKTLILCVFVCLGERDVLPLWMALVLIGRELIVSGVRDVAAAHGKVIGANWMGKTKTFLQVVAISFGLFFMARMDTGPGSGFPDTPAGRGLRTLGSVTVALSVVFAGMFVYWNRTLLFARPPGTRDAAGVPDGGDDTMRAARADTNEETDGGEP